jgi:hypothetical protein
LFTRAVWHNGPATFLLVQGFSVTRSICTKTFKGLVARGANVTEAGSMQNYTVLMAPITGAALGFAWYWRKASIKSLGTHSGYQFPSAIFGATIGCLTGAATSVLCTAVGLPLT